MTLSSKYILSEMKQKGMFTFDFQKDPNTSCSITIYHSNQQFHLTTHYVYANYMGKNEMGQPMRKRSFHSFEQLAATFNIEFPSIQIS